jgi:hypothetical protein
MVISATNSALLVHATDPDEETVAVMETGVSVGRLVAVSAGRVAISVGCGVLSIIVGDGSAVSVEVFAGSEQAETMRRIANVNANNLDSFITSNL